MRELESEESLTGDAKIISEAKRRFTQCQAFESHARKLFLDDIKFANGDSDNGYQWPQDIRNGRENEDRPCLTINKTRQHNLQVINDAKQNKAAIKINPVGNGATKESADVFEGVIRHIEYISNALVAYDTAVKYQVEGGIGYWRVVTDYADDESFDQEIFIRRIPDPLTVYIDPDINEKDGSDARFAFVFDDLPRDEFNKKYPEYKDKIGQTVFGDSDYEWVDDDHVRIAEYYRKVTKKDHLLSFMHPSTGEPTQMRASSIPEPIRSMAMEHPDTKTREIEDTKIEWHLMFGDVIADRSIWPGKYIPVVRIIGEEAVIDGRLDRKGHTRNLKDPQRIYNYWSSSAVEHVALQGKTPWKAPVAAIEGLETYWETANKVNHSILPYNHIDDEGNEIPSPERQMPPEFSQAYLEGMKVSQQEMMMVSGQYKADFGDEGNERSGKAINARQRQGDNATYHFIDNLAIGIRFTGKILLDLIPKIYDTPRIIRILAEDGSDKEVQLNPKAQAAYFEHQQQNAEEVKAIFNPNVGKYDVQSDVGPSYQTKRLEAFNALSQILQQAPDLVHIAGDILFKAADFPMAQEVAERLERMVPPQAKGDGPDPQVVALQQQLQSMEHTLAASMQQLAEEKNKNKNVAAQKEVDIYKAITDRLDVIAKHFEVTPKDKAVMLHDLMVQEHQAGLEQTGMVLQNELTPPEQSNEVLPQTT